MIKKRTVMNQLQVLAQENVVSIRDIQRNPSRVLKGITRVVKNNRTMGFYLDKENYEDLLEEEAMLNNPRFMKELEESYKQAKAGKTISLKDVAKEYGIQI